MSKSSNPLRVGNDPKALQKSPGQLPDQFTAAGKSVQCPHCGGTEFEQREILLNTRGATFLNLDWLNRGATTLTCRKCGRIEWFSAVPQKA